MGVSLELHHFFILVDPGASVADRLVDLGMIESPSNTHEGQGTANRRFFFDNCALELLYVHDADGARNGPGSELKLVERSARHGASPFGLVLTNSDATDSRTPFDGWKYQPDYFPAHMQFHVGDNSSDLSQPLCIYSPFFEMKAGKDQQNAYFNKVTDITVHVKTKDLSSVLELVDQADRINIQPGDEHLVICTFNNNVSGEEADMRPELPLVIRW